jgi:glycerophosphoryl diester phosphodiesterase
LARLVTLSLLAAAALSACSNDDNTSPATPIPFRTLDGNQPLVIGHRGLPGLYPEETLPSYENAADVGADSLEEDLHLTKDCVLIARHNPWLSDNTDIAEVAASNPDIAARKRTVPGRLVDVAYDASVYGGPAQYLSDLTDPTNQKSVLKSLIVDGEDHTNDWSITDFTLAELKQSIRGTTYDDAAERPTVDNGKYPVLSFQEIVNLAKVKRALTGRTITVYPESKNPYWNDQQGIANGCDTAGTQHPLEDAMLKIINDNGLNAKDAPVFVQSFDPASLKYFRANGLKTRVVQLIDGNTVDYKTSNLA